MKVSSYKTTHSTVALFEITEGVPDWQKFQIITEIAFYQYISI